MLFRFTHVTECISTSFFLLPNNLPLHGYTSFCLFIYQLKKIWVGLYTFLAIMHNVDMNIYIQFLCEHVFISLEHNIAKSGITGSSGNFTFSILKKC